MNSDLTCSGAMASAAVGGPSLSEQVLQDTWRYLAAECASCIAQGEQGKRSVRLIVVALIGGVSFSKCRAGFAHVLVQRFLG